MARKNLCQHKIHPAQSYVYGEYVLRAAGAERQSLNNSSASSGPISLFSMQTDRERHRRPTDGRKYLCVILILCESKEQ